MKITSIFVLLGILPFPLQSANLTQVNRYATVANHALPAQVNPLLAVQQIHFHQEVKTINDALTTWLRFSGFHLIAKDKQPEDLRIVLSQPLPQIDRHLGPLTVLEGLRTLVGLHEFEVIQNPILREINFKRIPTRKSA